MASGVERLPEVEEPRANMAQEISASWQNSSASNSDENMDKLAYCTFSVEVEKLVLCCRWRSVPPPRTLSSRLPCSYWRKRRHEEVNENKQSASFIIDFCASAEPQHCTSCTW